MDSKLFAVSKEVAVEMVKLSQKQRIKGSKGGWKDFLNFYGKKTGTSSRLSDPSRRPVETLVAFLNTLDRPEDVKFLLDSCAAKPAMELVSSEIELGADSGFPLASNNVPDVAMNKLLVQGIPVSASCEDLHKVIPGDFTVEVKAKVAVEMVKLSQKKSIEGSNGGWKDFLNFHGRKTGTRSRISDPSRRPVETLVAFLTTLDKPEDLKFLIDSCAAKPAMELVLSKIEVGADSGFQVASNNVPDVALNKLLVHGIPVGLSCEDLHKVIPGDFTVEVKAKAKNFQGARYSVFAIFENQHEADEAFDSIQADLDKDSRGRLQKEVKHFQLSKKGITGSLWIRKMAKDSPEPVTPERSLEFESTSDDLRKSLQTDRCESHLKEIERLKQELGLLQTGYCESHMIEIERLKQDLSQRDLEICSLKKTIARLEFYMMHVGIDC